MGRTSILWLALVHCALPLMAQRTVKQDIKIKPGVLQYTENKGQWAETVAYMVGLPGGSAFLQKTKVTYRFHDTKAFTKTHDHGTQGVSSGSTPIKQNAHFPIVPQRAYIDEHAFEMRFLNTDNDTRPIGANPQVTRFNYIIGTDPDQWITQARAYSSVLYKELYSGVDLLFYAQESSLKYDLHIARGADPSQIAFEYEGLEKVEIHNGNLYLKTSVNELMEKRPYAYQYHKGKKKEVQCDFVLEGDRVSFALGKYNRNVPLIIDPVLIFSTYSGSTADNWGLTAAPDKEGNLYSGGITNHYATGRFPASLGAFQTNTAGLWDLGILKYNPTGTTLEYATYLGGSGTEVPQSLIVSEGGELFILGVTGSADMPMLSTSLQTDFKGGSAVRPLVFDLVDFPDGSDLFLAKLSAEGDRLLAATYMGGTENDGLMDAVGRLVANYGDQFRGDVLLGKDDAVYVATKTFSRDFPLKNAYQNTFSGGEMDAILFKLDSGMSTLLWSTYYGGSGEDAAHSIKLDAEDNIYVCGGTDSKDLRGMDGLITDNQGGIDAWVASFTPKGNRLLHATYLGTPSDDQSYFLDLDNERNVYLYGQSVGEYPVIGMGFARGGGQFVHELTNEMDSSIFSSRFGSPGNTINISPTAFLVNECGNMYLAGWGGDTNNGYAGGDTFGMPVTDDAFQRSTSGSDFYLMVMNATGSDILYATFLGGTVSNTHVDGGTSRFDPKGIVYHAVCAGCQGNSDFPTTPGVVSRTNNSINCNNAAFKFDFSILKAALRSNTTDRSNPGIVKGCAPFTFLFENLSEGGIEFLWDFGDGSPEVSREDDSAVAHRYAVPGAYTVTLTALDRNTCLKKDVAAMEVEVVEANFDVSENDSICAGTTVQLSALGSAGSTYSWQDERNRFISSTSGISVSPDRTTDYYLTAFNASGCLFQDTVSIAVVPRAQAGFILSKEQECFGISRIEFANRSLAGTDFRWDFGDGNTSEERDPMHQYEKTGEYQVSLTTGNGVCFDRKTQIVQLAPLEVGNVFTPSVMDGRNDSFEVRAQVQVGLKVFNRWGKLVYENSDYKNEWRGENVAAGVYFYELSLDGDLLCKSWVQILR